MSEEEKIELSPWKTESPQEDVNENISQEQTIETTQPETQNPQLQTEIMEVHHHPKVEKKNLKEYLLEGLMIFIAVTLGFFAENIRETYSERKNAKEYAQLLMNDLGSDTTEFNRTTRVLNRIITCGDSLCAIITANPSGKKFGGKLYYYEYWSGWQWRVTPRDATLKQLENSGALRYLGNSSLIKKILDYEESLKIINLLEDNYTVEKNENWQLVQKIFYQPYFDTLDNIKAAARDSSSQISQVDVYRLDSFLNTNYPLITDDKSMIIELSNWALNSSRSYKILLTNVDFARQRAKNAIAALKEEYNFK